MTADDEDFWAKLIIGSIFLFGFICGIVALLN